MTPVAEKRQSSRIVPIGSSEDLVVLHSGNPPQLAKILDLSDGGVCVYLVEPDAPIAPGDRFGLSLYHQERVRDVEAQVCRRHGQVVSLEFRDLSPDAEHLLRAKIIRLEVEWMRVKEKL